MAKTITAEKFDKLADGTRMQPMMRHAAMRVLVHGDSQREAARRVKRSHQAVGKAIRRLLEGRPHCPMCGGEIKR